MTAVLAPGQDAARPVTSWLRTALRIAGGALVVWLAALCALLEVFFTPLRLGGVRAPVSLLLVVLVNLGLPLLARWLTQSRRAALLPGLVWFVLVLFFAGGTSEGDIALAGNDWAALTLLLLGSVTAATGGYVALSAGPPRWLRRRTRARR